MQKLQEAVRLTPFFVQAIKEARCGSKEEFTEMAAGVKVEDDESDQAAEPKPKKEKKDKSKKVGT